jgi:hypothetical protein
MKATKLDPYSRSPDATLLIRTKGRYAILRQGALPVPIRGREAVETVLQVRSGAAVPSLA